MTDIAKPLMPFGGIRISINSARVIFRFDDEYPERGDNCVVDLGCPASVRWDDEIVEPPVDRGVKHRV
jgi:hypothetical protein